MIGQHPALYGVPELYLQLGDTVGDVLRNITDTSMLNGLVRTLAQLGFEGQGTEECLDTIQLLLETQDAKSANVWKQIERLAGKPLVEKSPGIAYNMKCLNRLPKDAYFIHLTRHPKTWQTSIEQWVNWHPQQVKDMHAVPYAMWQHCNSNIERFLKNIPKPDQYRISGELIVSDPKKGLGMICDKFGLEYSDAMLHPENCVYAHVGNVYAPYGQDPLFLNSPKLREAEASFPDLENLPIEILQMAERYGYGAH